ncbi:ribulose 1,5-bisphosphate carboxylase large subunit [Erythrobacter longus]|uniref:Ribulose 1,5-bisphosphate carboxylase large subunit n=1 Tax=Erythrobacter longus TaxID=1044 RepID=A0A074M9P5_ERYLO|nr:RuBisCO large subunit C-terminal-like domain-containing protein [Erythrobacter longus]KEO90109.1 ribulose 1,5-bisphosphate carboxylase large subunit [Erythrobacter longus]
MIADTQVAVSGERLTVTYSLHAGPKDALAIAEKATTEQTIEFPPELIGDDGIRDHIFGRIERFEAVEERLHHADISYAVECSAFNLPQLFNLIYGNISLFPQMRVERFALPQSLASVFKGPRFGIAGLRETLAAPKGPLFMTALKPQGLPANRLAAQAYEFARGGLDIVKDDHGLANQPFAPFRERVAQCCDAVARANAETGGNTVYAPMISGPSEQIVEQAFWAKEQGAGALLIAPALIGFDVARRLAQDDALGLPMIGHPAMMGSYVVSPTNGFSHYAMFGQVMRLVGMDVSIFPNFGGRFAFSPGECRSIMAGCTDPMDHFASIVPSPGGGMTFENVPDMARFYGEDVMYLMGGDLHKQAGTLEENCWKLRALANVPDGGEVR